MKIAVALLNSITLRGILNCIALRGARITKSSWNDQFIYLFSTVYFWKFQWFSSKHMAIGLHHVFFFIYRVSQNEITGL